jgi:hypothetical protein
LRTTSRVRKREGADLKEINKFVNNHQQGKEEEADGKEIGLFIENRQ